MCCSQMSCTVSKWNGTAATTKKSVHCLVPCLSMTVLTFPLAWSHIVLGPSTLTQSLQAWTQWSLLLCSVSAQWSMSVLYSGTGIWTKPYHRPPLPSGAGHITDQSHYINKLNFGCEPCSGKVHRLIITNTTSPERAHSGRRCYISLLVL